MQPQLASRSSLDFQNISDIAMDDGQGHWSNVDDFDIPVAEPDRHAAPYGRPVLVTKANAVGIPLKVRILDTPVCSGRAANNSSTTDMAKFLPFPLRLTDLNYDVLERIMALLPAGSLSALMKTCRFFSEVAVEPLCRYSNVPFTEVDLVLSFVHFLRPGSTAPRSPFVHDLHFGECLEYPRNFYDRQGMPHSTQAGGLFVAILEILRHCRNLRTLRFECWIDSWKLKAFSETVATLPSLTELHIAPYKFGMTEQGISQLRMSLPELRKLKLVQGRYVYDTTPSRHLLALPTPLKLVELELEGLFFDASAILPPVPFTHVYRLTLSWQYHTDLPVVLYRSFPNLVHLNLQNASCPARCHNASGFFGDVRSLDRSNDIRARHKKRWAALRFTSPAPALRSLSVNHGCALYALAYPRRVPHLSYKQNGPADFVLPMLETALRDAAPRRLNLHIEIEDDSDRSAAEHPHTIQDVHQLRMLHASPCLTHLVLTIDRVRPGPDTHTAASWRTHDAFRRVIPALALTHLLVVHASDPPHHACASRAGRCADLDALRGTAAALADGSPTLRWLAVLARPCGIRAWGVRRRGDALEGAAALVEMPEDEAWAVVRAEGMLGD